jgi:SAM-dependent methyltransferase
MKSMPIPEWIRRNPRHHGADLGLPARETKDTLSAPEQESSKHRRHLLRFTNDMSRTEFDDRCSEHDFWYHSYYFDNGFVREGDYDIGRDVQDYCFPEAMEGMTVLDVGTGSGWFATYFEQMGADVTTVDARGYCDFDIFGRDSYPDVAQEKSNPDRVLEDGRSIYYSPVSKGFWVMKDILGLRARYVNARAYDIQPALFSGQRFDLVFMGSILMHLRDPIGALMAAHSVCQGQLIATSYMQGDGSVPTMTMPIAAGDGISWWVPNEACLEQWIKAAGFPRLDISRTVKLSVDTPYLDTHGRSSGASQVHQVVHAWV